MFKKKHIILIVYIITLFNCTNTTGIDNKNKDDNQRVVSLAPSLTEIICSVGAGKKLVGVTDYCNYPPEITESIPRVGGYADINIEKLVELNPDIVFILPYHSKIQSQLNSFKINTHVCTNTNIEEIVYSIEEIGEVLGCSDTADLVIANFNRELSEIQTKYKNKVHIPKVLICVGREYGKLKNIFVAGIRTYYNDILNIINVRNAMTSDIAEFPMVNAESIATMNPDIIIEIYGMGDNNKKDRRILEDWRVLKTINAVKHNQLYFIKKDYAVVPSIRIIELLKDIEKIISKYYVYNKNR